MSVRGCRLALLFADWAPSQKDIGGAGAAVAGPGAGQGYHVGSQGAAGQPLEDFGFEYWFVRGFQTPPVDDQHGLTTAPGTLLDELAQNWFCFVYEQTMQIDIILNTVASLV